MRRETTTETDVRLRRVLRAATLTVLPGAWRFEEFHRAQLTGRLRADALALVRDGDAWSQLVPASPPDDQGARFRMWTVHFPPRIDNSGFVGWLGSHIKQSTGSGVIIICGQNSNDGGIFDYWGCDDTRAEEVLAAVNELRAAG